MDDKDVCLRRKDRSLAGVLKRTGRAEMDYIRPGDEIEFHGKPKQLSVMLRIRMMCDAAGIPEENWNKYTLENVTPDPKGGSLGHRNGCLMRCGFCDETFNVFSKTLSGTFGTESFPL